VYIANFGRASEYAARMDFSSDFFKLGGFSVFSGNQYEIDNQGIALAINDVSDKGSKVMVVCSSDNNYPLFVDELAKEFKRLTSDSMLILAGYPAEYANQFRISGIDEFIHIKSDILEQLRKVLNKY
jgi:methylmalonyl-CoA mutase